VELSGLALPLADSTRLKRRVHALAENRPGVYRMLDPSGAVIYVGKAKRLRARLLSYFRARYPDQKAARILDAAADVTWDYTPSEFAAHLTELRLITRYRPVFNVQMNRPRRLAFVKLSRGPAPKLYAGAAPSGDDILHYGPYPAPGRLREALRVLNDLLGLRDCALTMPIVYAAQRDLFTETRHAACIRHALGTCLGPCAGLVDEARYGAAVETAIAFLEGRAIAPLDRIIGEMQQASAASAFERATRWRDRFDALEWLFAAGNRVRAAIDALSFVYVDAGRHGDDRAYVIKRATVRASAPAPRTPIEREAFRALVAEHVGPETSTGPIPPAAIEETLLLLSWFRRHPAALRHTLPMERWLADGPVPC